MTCHCGEDSYKRKADDDKLQKEEEEAIDDELQKEKADDDELQKEKADDDELQKEKADDDELQKEEADDDKCQKEEAVDNKNCTKRTLLAVKYHESVGKNGSVVLYYRYVQYNLVN